MEGTSSQQSKQVSEINLYNQSGISSQLGFGTTKILLLKNILKRQALNLLNFGFFKLVKFVSQSLKKKQIASNLQKLLNSKIVTLKAYTIKKLRNALLFQLNTNHFVRLLSRVVSSKIQRYQRKLLLQIRLKSLKKLLKDGDGQVVEKKIQTKVEQFVYASTKKPNSYNKCKGFQNIETNKKECTHKYSMKNNLLIQFNKNQEEPIFHMIQKKNNRKQIKKNQSHPNLLINIPEKPLTYLIEAIKSGQNIYNNSKKQEEYSEEEKLLQSLRIINNYLKQKQYQKCKLYIENNIYAPKQLFFQGFPLYKIIYDLLDSKPQQIRPIKYNQQQSQTNKQLQTLHEKMISLQRKIHLLRIKNSSEHDSEVILDQEDTSATKSRFRKQKAEIISIPSKSRPEKQQAKLQQHNNVSKKGIGKIKVSQAKKNINRILYSGQQQPVQMIEKQNERIKNTHCEQVSFDSYNGKKEAHKIKQQCKSFNKIDKNIAAWDQFSILTSTISSLLQKKMYEEARKQLEDFLSKHQQKIIQPQMIALNHLLRFLPEEEEQQNSRMKMEEQTSSQKMLQKLVQNLENQDDPMKDIQVGSAQQKMLVLKIVQHFKSQFQKRQKNRKQKISKQNIPNHIVQQIPTDFEGKQDHDINEKTRIIRILLHNQQELQKQIQYLKQNIDLSREQMIGINEFQTVVKQLEQIHEKFQEGQKMNQYLLQENMNLKRLMVAQKEKNENHSFQNPESKKTMQKYQTNLTLLKEYEKKNEQINQMFQKSKKQNSEQQTKLKKQIQVLKEKLSFFQQQFQRMENQNIKRKAAFNEQISEIQENKNKIIVQQKLKCKQLADKIDYLKKQERERNQHAQKIQSLSLINETNKIKIQQLEDKIKLFQSDDAEHFKKILEKKSQQINFLEIQKQSLQQQNEKVKKIYENLVEGVHQLEKEKENTNWQQRYMSLAIQNAKLKKSSAVKPQTVKSNWEQKYNFVCLQLKNFKKSSKKSYEIIETRLNETKQEVDSLKYEKNLTQQKINLLFDESVELKVKNQKLIKILQQKQQNLTQEINKLKTQKEFCQEIYKKQLKQSQQIMNGIKMKKQADKLLIQEKEREKTNIDRLHKKSQLIVENLKKQCSQLSEKIQCMTQEKSNFQESCKNYISQIFMLQEKISQLQNKYFQNQEKVRKYSRQLKIAEQKAQAETDQYLYIINGLQQQLKSQTLASNTKNQQLKQLKRQYFLVQEVMKSRQNDSLQKEKKIKKLEQLNLKYQKQLGLSRKSNTKIGFEGKYGLSNKRPKVQSTYLLNQSQIEEEEYETATQVEILNIINTEFTDLVQINRRLQLKIALLQNYTQHLGENSTDMINYFLILQENMQKLLSFLIAKKYISRDDKFRSFLMKANCCVIKIDDEEYLKKWLQFMKELFIEVYENKERQVRKQNIQMNQMRSKMNDILDISVQERCFNQKIHQLNNCKMIIADVRFLLMEYLRNQDSQVLKLMSESLGLVNH